MEKEKRLTNRQKQAMATKEKIQEAALELFSQKSFSAVTMESICQKAGVSKGLFYNYFPTKSAILLEGFAELDRTYRDMAESFSDAMPLREKLLTFWEKMLRQIHKNQINLSCCKANYYEAIKTGKSYVNDPDRYISQLTQSLIREGKETGALRPAVSEETALRAVLILSSGSILASFMESDTERFMPAVARTLGLGADGLLAEGQEE